MIWVRRAVVMGGALLATAIIFRFWGDLSGAMNDYFSMKPAVSVSSPSGEVTVGIIPDKSQKPACGKTHPCQ